LFAVSLLLTLAFEQIPALCHSLEYMEWWASDELMWEWDVVSCAPAKPTPLEREVRKKLGLKDIENERNIGGRRKVKLVGEPRIDLGAVSSLHVTSSLSRVADFR
jgi:hypothetical protein